MKSGPAYYNEINSYAAQWLRNLIDAGHIAPGVVDERSIEDVHPSDLAGFTQCHFFAGIGVWSYALRRAGWPDDRPVWTGSCPCQPFSAAGKGAGAADERHLWPAWFHLISQCRPDAIRGEQVASADALVWLDLVQSDLEAAGYACGAVDLCAAGVGAPHIRQRLWIVADANERAGGQGSPHVRGRADGSDAQPRAGLGGGGVLGGLADSDCWQCHGLAVVSGDEQHRHDSGRAQERSEPESRSQLCGLANPGDGPGQRGEPRSAEWGLSPTACQDVSGESAGPTNGLWANADWLRCRDGKWRPVEPGTFPLAHGASSRVGRLRAYGNAINAQAAEIFIRATA